MWTVPARIAGKAVCLREEQRCAAHLRRQYERYGFACTIGRRLVVRWSYLRRRPLTELTVAPRASSPVTTRTGRVGSFVGLGPGPAYPIGSSSVVTFRLPPPPEFGPDWGE